MFDRTHCEVLSPATAVDLVTEKALKSPRERIAAALFMWGLLGHAIT